MCGLLYGKRFGAPISKIIAKRYKTQSARGKQGFGYIAVKDGVVSEVKRFATEVVFLQSLKDETTDEILCHHRAATSATGYVEHTHPVVVEDKLFDHKYYLIHNGTLTNHHTLKEEHEKLGLVYNTSYQKFSKIKFISGPEIVSEASTGFLDSEALAKEVALFIENKKDTIDIKGSAAFICYQTDRVGKIQNIFYGRNGGRELVTEEVGNKNRPGNHIIIKSEGGGRVVPVDTLYRWEYSTGKHYVTEVDIGEAYPPTKRVNSYGYRIPYHEAKNVRTVPQLPVPNDYRGLTIKDYSMSDPKDRDEYMFDLEKIVKSSAEWEILQRLDEIQEEMLNNNTSKKEWEDWIDQSEDSKDIADAQYEIDELETLDTELSQEMSVLNSEIIEREGVPSPYEQDAINWDEVDRQ